MSIAVAHTFVAALKSVGMVIPEDTQKITISCEDALSDVRVVFHCIDIGSGVVKKSGASIIGVDGSEMTSQQFYRAIKEVAQLPDETTKFTITADMENIVTIDLCTAFPLDAVEALRGCKFESLPK